MLSAADTSQMTTPQSTSVNSKAESQLKVSYSVENSKVSNIREDNLVKKFSKRKESKERLVNLNCSAGEAITEINVSDSMRLIDVLLNVCINKGLNPQVSHTK